MHHSSVRYNLQYQINVNIRVSNKNTPKNDIEENGSKSFSLKQKALMDLAERMTLAK